MYEDVLRKIVNSVIKSRVVIVKVDRKGHSYTNGREIVVSLPKNIEIEDPEEIFPILKTLTYHEIGHILFSSMSAFKQAIENTTRTITSLGTSNENPSNSRVLSNLIRRIYNIVEDGRIENLMAVKYSETGKYFFLLNSQICRSDEKPQSEGQAILNALLEIALFGKFRGDPKRINKEGRKFIKAFEAAMKKCLIAESSAMNFEIMHVILCHFRGLIIQMSRDFEARGQDLDLPMEFETIPRFEYVTDVHTYAFSNLSNFEDARDQVIKEIQGDLMNQRSDLLFQSDYQTLKYYVYEKGERVKFKNHSKAFIDRLWYPHEIINVQMDLQHLPEKFASEVKGLKKSIQKVIEVKKSQRMGAFHSGHLDQGRIYRLKTYKTDVFQKRVDTEKTAAISLLVDFSGSMSGPKIQEAMEACAVIEEAIHTLVPFEVAGFTANKKVFHYMIKAFEQKCGGINYTYSFYKRNQFEMKENYEHDSLLIAGDRLNRRPETNKVIIILTDGLPLGSEALMRTNLVVRALAQKGIVVIALLYGMNQSDKIHASAMAKLMYKHYQFTHSGSLLQDFEKIIKEVVAQG